MFGNLNFDSKIKLFLEQTCNISKVSSIIYNSGHSFYDEYLKKSGDFINLENFDTISFIPKSKLDSMSSFDSIKSRIPIKVGKIVSKFFKKETIRMHNVTNSDVESFVNLFKSYFDSSSIKFEIVSGPDILKWYLEENYYQPNGSRPGTLWKSCMRYSNRNSFMKLYSDNPDIKMLITLDVSGKLRSRALLWDDITCTNDGKYKVMDRIYSVFDHEIESLKLWANKNGYLYKNEQSCKNNNLFIQDGIIKEFNLSIKLKNYMFDTYPYLDTFCFFDKRKGIISNFITDFNNLILNQVNGMTYVDDNPDDDDDYDPVIEVENNDWGW